jgi:hypothetical protein
MSTLGTSWKIQIIRELLLERYLGCPANLRRYGVSLRPACAAD